MNKKVLLTTTAMAMIAAMAVSADVNFSGSFQQGYDTIWEGDDFSAINDSVYNNGTEGDTELDLTIADADNLWSLELGTWTEEADFFNDDMSFEGALTVDLGAGLAAQGVELPMGLSFTIGNAADNTGLSVFNDDDQDSDKIEVVGGDTFTVVDMTYGDMGAAQVAFSPIDNRQALDLSVEVMPMDGVSMAFGWAHAFADATLTAPDTANDVDEVKKHGSYVEGEDFQGYQFFAQDNLFGGSFSVDVDKLADLGDYTVNTTGTMTYVNDDAIGDNGGYKDEYTDYVANFAVNTTVGYDAYSAYAQYAATFDADEYNSALNTWVAYEGFENTYLDFGVNVMSLNDHPEDSVEIYATVDYTMGDITYEMSPEYDFADGDDTFLIYWNVQMDF